MCCGVYCWCIFQLLFFRRCSSTPDSWEPVLWRRARLWQWVDKGTTTTTTTPYQVSCNIAQNMYDTNKQTTYKTHTKKGQTNKCSHLREKNSNNTSNSVSESLPAHADGLPFVSTYRYIRLEKTGHVCTIKRLLYHLRQLAASSNWSGGQGVSRVAGPLWSRNIDISSDYWYTLFWSMPWNTYATPFFSLSYQQTYLTSKVTYYGGP